MIVGRWLCVCRLPGAPLFFERNACNTGLGTVELATWTRDLPDLCVYLPNVEQPPRPGDDEERRKHEEDEVVRGCLCHA